jgi:hypothetical protein
METLAAEWIDRHPEYHADLADLQAALAAVYTVEEGRTNPFLHLSMHLSISEQCSIDQPRGIRQAVELLAARRGDLFEPVVGAVHGVDVAARGPGDDLAVQRDGVHLLLPLAQRGLDQRLALLRVGLDAGLRGQRVELVVARTAVVVQADALLARLRITGVSVVSASVTGAAPAEHVHAGVELLELGEVGGARHGVDLDLDADLAPTSRPARCRSPRR